VELDTKGDPPAGNIWLPEWIPPFCPAECRNQCPALFGIWTYTINVYRNMPYYDIYRFKQTWQDIIQVGATEWYFDRYGCRKAPPPAADEIAGGAVATTLFLHETLNSAELAPYWRAAKAALQGMGVPPPGHVRTLPQGATGLTALAFAASR
jgi:hypothetical protein